MSALPSRAMPDDLALLHVLEATIETLKAENEILRRRLAAAETRAAALGDGGSWNQPGMGLTAGFPRTRVDR